MRRWAGLLALFLLATLGALAISARMRPGEWERRHAMIRVGMTPAEEKPDGLRSHFMLSTSR
jgi:hypothetical protein